ncbi:UNVERIFIED_CONTAM: hypothetical protein FKN15_035701 [Acipenser sinensis]
MEPPQPAFLICTRLSQILQQEKRSYEGVHTHRIPDYSIRFQVHKTMCKFWHSHRVLCCAMRRSNPCWFPIPHSGSASANVTPSSGSPATFGLFAQPGHELAPSKLCDSSYAPSGSALTG